MPAYNKKPAPLNKFGARKITVPGEGTFDSQKEFNRYRELVLLQKAHEISDLERQKKYMVLPQQDREKPVFYIADFVYKDKNGETVVEDVKGYRRGAAYEVFVLKRKLMLYSKGIRVVEV